MEEITLNHYQELAGRTSGAGQDGERRQIIAALGLAGEAGEFANLIKKGTAHGHDIPSEKLAEELGDILWYVAEAASSLGLTLDQIGQDNIAKLKSRYPQGFSQDRSRNRKE
jgi:NTP pyrophosphatase (non-canonical NTP hydrolase)